MTLATAEKARLAVRRAGKPVLVALALLVFSQTALAAPPTGDFTVSPAVPNPGELVTFTSTGVSDPGGGTPPSVQWDFGDGAGYGPTGSPNDAATYTYMTPGTRSVKMLITGSDGEREVQKSVRVNAPPVASFIHFPASPFTGELVGFVSDSGDPDGPLASQTWDLDNDGQFDDASGRRASRSFTTAGPNTVSLRVTDPSGASDDVSIVITVRAHPAAAANAPSLMSPFPVVRIVGRAGRNTTRITRMSVKARPGATVTVTCVGKSCPKPGTAQTTSRGKSIRFRRLERRLRSGTRIGIRVTFPGQIGKYTSFIIKRNKRPARRDLCLRPGVTRPVACPSG